MCVCVCFRVNSVSFDFRSDPVLSEKIGDFRLRRKGV